MASVASSNPFGLLATKRLKGDPNKFAGTKGQTPAAGKVEDTKKAPVDQGPAKKSRVISLTAAPVAEPKEEVAPTKAERETKDRHVDRSAKRDHTRKGGQGVGGWEGTGGVKPEDADNAEAAAAIAEGGEETEENSPAGQAAKAEPVEEEKPTFTLAQFEAERAKRKPQLALSTRQVDTSAFKNMTQMKATEEDTFMTVSKKVQETKKPEPKPVAKAGGKKGAAPVVAAPQKVDNHAKPKKQDKEASAALELGFRMAAFATEGGRGRGRGGRGRGEFGRGGRGGRGPRPTDGETPAAETAEGQTPAEGAPAAEGAEATEAQTTEAAPAATTEVAAPQQQEGGRGRGGRGGYDREGGRGEGRGYGRGGRGGYDRDREPREGGRGEGRGYGRGGRGGFDRDREPRGEGRGYGGRSYGRGRGARDEPRQPNVESEVDFPKLGK